MMRRVVAIVLLAGLLAGVEPASAAKKKRAAKPVKTVLYLDGTMDVAEAEDPLTFQKLNPQEPDGSIPKSKQILNYGAGPNVNCAGNSLFPVFVGPIEGTIVGPIKITLHTLATPGGSVDLRIWPDVNSQLCNSGTTGAMDYVEPSASVIAPLPPGPGVLEAETPAARFTARALLMLQVTPVLVPPFFGRVFYDAGGYESRIEFDCIPRGGKKSCV